ncbi:MAG: hypothetical protein ACOVQ4_03715 [Flectobacillus sp.]|uniref:hypothetical protein n=1 Tax=Flectobacillus sp. TaxID=50419 RepID=UPI003B9929D3
MIKINKGKEPQEWTAKYNTPDFTQYESIPALRQALLEEQGFICAYCMRQIPVKDLSENETSKIEHIKSRSDYPDLQLEYNNMLICCPRSIDGDSHCDKSKEHQSISYSLFVPQLQQSIFYSSKDGTIKSSVPTIDDELNRILNLNNRRLKANRLQVIEAIIATLEKKKWKKREYEQQLEVWKTKTVKQIEHEDKLVFKPYCGVVTYFLEKKLKQYK